jgi:hypothetical protein
MWSQQLQNDALFQEVREEVLDMGQYLDSDASRRQSDIVLRLTVVTILGLIGTIATGFLGMNLIDETAQPLWAKIGIFLAVMVPSVVVRLFTVLKSGRLAEFIDAMANERLSAREKLGRLGRVFHTPCDRAKLPGASHESVEARRARSTLALRALAFRGPFGGSD